MSIKPILKRSIQGISATLAPLAWRLQRKPKLIVLMYHRVLPKQHPDRELEQAGMFVSPETLEMHLATLRQHFSFVHLDDWIAAVRDGKMVPARACAITFDDGWRDNYEYAYPLLTKYQIPATIYLVADAVGTRYAFWPNRLTKLLHLPEADLAPVRLPDWLRQLILQVRSVDVNRGAFTTEQIDRVITKCKLDRTDAQMLEALECINVSDDARDLFDWTEARTMLASELIRFGSHTRRHTRLLDQVAHATMMDEVVGSRQVIRERLGVEPKTFCYPNGDHSAAAVEQVRGLYVGAVTTARGWNELSSDRHLLRRVGVHEDVSNTPAAFLSRLAGIG